MRAWSDPQLRRNEYEDLLAAVRREVARGKLKALEEYGARCGCVARTMRTPGAKCHFCEVRQQYEEGLGVIESGIDTIRGFLEEYDQSHRAEECVELVSLERWRDEILAKEERAAAARPKSAIQILRQKLDAAVAAEEFEEAARLRDEIRRRGHE